MTLAEREQAVLLNCGPRAVLTAFSAVTALGLAGWTRDAVHVLVPAGARVRPIPDVPIRIHRAKDWARVRSIGARPLEAFAPSTIRAAGTLATTRSVCGLLAAAVQQRCTSAGRLITALDRAGNVRHRRAMLLALRDIEQGAQALSEIDFLTLCRRYRLPPPRMQAVRIQKDGRRRYLDALWELADGTMVAVEVDGAIHLAASRWFDDQLRHNEIALTRTMVLRYPSFVIRSQPELVADQLARALGVGSA